MADSPYEPQRQPHVAPEPRRVEVLERPEPRTWRPDEDEGDHDRMSHFVYPASAVTRALIEGTPVTALCGKTWVPTRDPQRYPVCPTCKELRDAILARNGNGEGPQDS
jgi:hypothetical protein